MLFVIISVLITVAVSFNFIIMPKLFLDELMDNRRPEYFVLFLSIFVIIGFMSRIISDVINRMKVVSRERLTKGLQLKMSSSIMQMDFENTENPAILDLREQVMAAITMRNMQNRFIDICTNFITHVIQLVSLGILISFLNPLLILALLFIVLFNNLVSKRLKDINFSSERIFNIFTRRWGYFSSLTENFSIGKDARIYTVGDLLEQEYDKFNRKAYDLNMNVMKKSGAFNGLISTNEHLQMLIVYLYITYRTVAGVLSVGDFAMFINAANRMSSTIFNTVNNLIEFKYINEYIDDYLKILTIGAENKRNTNALPMPSHIDYIEFRNVSFRYPNSKGDILHRINITIKAGEKISIIGENGAGKTTFIKLLCGLYKPTSGEILWNGTSINNYDIDEYRKMFSVIFQDFKLFACTVMENVAFDDNADEQAVTQALSRSNIDTYALPKGLHTEVYRMFDEQGVEFSGGENQKIAIARAIYKNTPLVILDEPTSSLDPYSEYEILSHVNEMGKDKTILFISHRLSTCRLCDRVVVFQSGEIVQCDSHDKLILEKDSLYYDMYNAQAQYYV